MFVQQAFTQQLLATASGKRSLVSLPLGIFSAPRSEEISHGLQFRSWLCCLHCASLCSPICEGIVPSWWDAVGIKCDSAESSVRALGVSCYCSYNSLLYYYTQFPLRQGLGPVISVLSSTFFQTVFAVII